MSIVEVSSQDQTILIYAVSYSTKYWLWKYSVFKVFKQTRWYIKNNLLLKSISNYIKTQSNVSPWENQLRPTNTLFDPSFFFIHPILPYCLPLFAWEHHNYMEKRDTRIKRRTQSRGFIPGREKGESRYLIILQGAEKSFTSLSIRQLTYSDERTKAHMKQIDQNSHCQILLYDLENKRWSILSWKFFNIINSNNILKILCY